MSKCKWDFGTFTDGSITTNIVGVSELFESKEDFLDACLKDYDYICEGKTFIVEDVKVKYIRYYPTGIEGCDIEGDCYSFGNKGKGATKVYCLDIN